MRKAVVLISCIVTALAGYLVGVRYGNMAPEQLRSALGIATPTVAIRPRIERATFDPLYRTGKLMLSVISTGASRERFTEVQQTLAAEISVARDRLKTTEEAKMLDLYASGAAILEDVQLLWAAEDGAIERARLSSNRDTHVRIHEDILSRSSDRTLARMGDLSGAFASTYNLELSKSPDWNLRVIFSWDLPQVVSSVAEHAAKRLREGEAAYLE
ncbi:MAG: hypothetical protein ACHQ50_15015 [Fimbriimonadales bacterium]